MEIIIVLFSLALLGACSNSGKDYIVFERYDKFVLWMLWIDESANCFLSSDGFGIEICLSKDDSRKLLTILSE